jgi:predicted flap endonuclease-1-like 5' DNA nuclease
MSTYTVTCSNPFHRHTTVSVSGTEHQVSFSLDAERRRAVATDVPEDVATKLADDPAYTLHADAEPDADESDADESDADESDADEPEGDDPEADDLTTLKGVGPATAATLQEAGITTFEALAEATAVPDLSDEQVDELRGKAKAHL